MRATPRQLWQLLEPVHAVVYFAPETKDEAAALGLSGRGTAYVGFRAAPLGAATPATVTAVLHGFHPDLVVAAVTAAQAQARPEQLVAARLSAAGRALRRLLPEAAGAEPTARLAELLGDVVRAVDVAGRPLAAANGALMPPTDPLRAVWHATTVLREHRGDGHVAALLTAGVGPCAAHVLRAVTGGGTAEALRTTRGWSGAEWAAAEAELQDRGWLDSAGALNKAGRRAHREYEQLTDDLAEGPWRHLGDARLAEVVALLEPLATAVVAGGGVPVGGGLGSPWPPTPGATAAGLNAP